jgi:hypothetical protein
MADPVQNAEDNLQQYLRQQMLGQQRVRTQADFPAAVEARLAETADTINYQLGPSAPPFAAEAARSVIDKNTDDMIDYYNFLQFEQDPSNILERRAIDEAVYTGKVPFGYEDSDYLYTQGSKGVLGNSLIPEVAERLGISRDINVAGNKAAFSQVPIHEGMHPLVKLPKKEEEAALRALDYFRMKRYGNSAEAQKILKEAGYDVTRPFGLGNARVLALKGAMSMTDDQFQDLSDVDRAELQESFDAYKKAPGLISSVLGSLTGEAPQPEFDNMIITPEKAAEMSEEDFNTLLKAAPAFTFERAFSRSIDITGPRMIGEGDSAVRAYEFGGVAKADPDRIDSAAELIRNTSPETFFSDIREAKKMQRVEGREYGDLLPFVSREQVDRGPEGIDTTYYFDPRAGGIADTVIDKLLQLGEKATDYFYSDADSKVQNYEDGGPVGPQDDLFPDTIKEGIGTLVEYAPKVAKVAGRGIGDLVRSDPLSPPELATQPPPADQLDFIAGYSPVYSHNIPAISGRVVEQLYSPEQSAVNRADLFINPEKMGETAPRISKQDITQLLKDIRQQIDVQNLRLEIQGKEAGVTPSEEIKQIFSQKLVADRLVDFIRNETGVTDPEQLQRMVSEIVMTTTSSMDPTEPQGFADGGVVSLKDKAVNMTRGPRSNGIMQYVPYMTGATNGY